MGDTLDFPAFPGQPELDGMDRAQLLSCLERIQLMLEHLDELEPEDMDSVPSLVIIMIIAAFIQNFAHLPAVQNAFAGIRMCVCVLILNAVVKLWKKSVVDWKTFLIFLLVFAGSVFLNISPVLYVLAAAVAGIVIRELEARKA